MFELTKRITHVDASEIHDNLVLPYELRIRGRLRTTSETGLDVGLFLNRGPVLRDGDLLEAATGEVFRIRAAVEQVVTARIDDGLPLARLCYHLGNRHVTLAIGQDDDGSYVRFPPDHVLEELAERLGATVVHHTAPFDPEPGAYTQAGHSHSHSHSHSHDHDHGHSHDHSHSHSH
ncbi:urease accessory protein UreE [Marinobacter oulmenensis]|uniref:Urease accessory protein UreE n=1 Tax=Marinobacter oulmenensis TaxID=643747 RepID=A0A840UMJ7_9GAMM|nr:urease accessory protein UreE [Marinobacter oulmenensis]MBB5321878.1 urease accessory protein [Marinobacter oulmenensis]